jgi:hypothetical protein
MTNEKQQTGVEWLVSQLQKTRDWQRVINEANQSGSSVRDVVEQAKEMDKSKAFEIFKAGQDSMEEGGKGFEQWYEQAYEGGNK